MAADSFGGQDGGAGPNERIEDDVTAPRTVPDSVGDESNRLDSGMNCQIVEPTRAERVHAGVIPDVGTVPAISPQLNIVEVGCFSVFENKNRFVLEAVKRALTSVRF